MENIYTKEDLLLLYRSLPDDLQHIIFSPETSDHYDAIAKKFALNDAQRKSLSHQSSLLLMGVTQPQRFVIALTDELKISREQAALIAQDLNLNIFNSVKSALTEVYSGATSSAAPAEIMDAPKAIVAAVQPTPAIATPPTPLGSIFEQKLGGTFRMSSAIPSMKTVGEPMLIVPPPPEATTPTPFAAGSSVVPATTDSYREPI